MSFFFNSTEDKNFSPITEKTIQDFDKISEKNASDDNSSPTLSISEEETTKETKTTGVTCNLNVYSDDDDDDDDLDRNDDDDSSDSDDENSKTLSIKLDSIIPNKYKLAKEESSFVIQVNDFPRYYVSNEETANEIIWELARKINFQILCEYGHNSKIYLNETVCKITNSPILKIERISSHLFFLSTHSTLVKLTYHKVDKIKN